MVRTLIKGYPVKDTVSILKIPCQGRDLGSNPSCGPSFRIVTANLKQQYSVKVRERFDSVAARFGVTVALV